MTMGPSMEYVKRCLELADEFPADAKLYSAHSRLKEMMKEDSQEVKMFPRAALFPLLLQPKPFHKN